MNLQSKHLLRSLASFIWIAVLSIGIGFSATIASASSKSLTGACPKPGLVKSSAGKQYTCLVSGKRYLWSKGTVVKRPAPTPTASPVAPIPTTSPSPVATPTPTPVATEIAYAPSDKTTLHRISDTSMCANPLATKAILQAEVKSEWLPVHAVDSGWTKSASNCGNPALGSKNSLAWESAFVDPGTKLRWYLIGEINIGVRDSLGNGVGNVFTFTPNPTEGRAIVIPHPVVGDNPITWSTLVSRFNDISASAWSDAQATIVRNSNLPSAHIPTNIYIGKSAGEIEPGISKAATWLQRDVAMYANFPQPTRILYFATTLSDLTETITAAQSLTSSTDVTGSLSSLYGSGAFQQTACQNHNGARAGTVRADFTAYVITSVCPGGAADSEGGVAHEYIHQIQATLLPEGNHHLYEPCWMTEGQPEWTAAAEIQTFQGYLNYQHFHPYLLSQDGLSGYSIPSQNSWSQSEVLAYLDAASDPTQCFKTNQFAFSYSFGAAMIEALVAVGGTESHFSLEQRLGQGEAFGSAFSAVYGIEWSKAEPILAEVVAKKISLSFTPQALTYQTQPTP